MDQGQWMRVYNLLTQKERSDIANYAVEKLLPGYTLKPKQHRKVTRGNRSIPVKLGRIEYPSLAQACKANDITMSEVASLAKQRSCLTKDAIIMIYNERTGKIT